MIFEREQIGWGRCDLGVGQREWRRGRRKYIEDREVGVLSS
jgi:hypothetical protein